MAGTITHSWNGTVLTITSDSGTSSCDLKGATGDTGIRGPQGIQGEKGETGAGEQGLQGKAFTYEDFTEEQLAALVGPEGPAGKDGVDGEKGDTGAAGRTSAYNLLNNSYFVNPVNQRNASGTIGTYSYFIDRWCSGGAEINLSLTQNGMIINNQIRQYIEFNRIAGKTVTLAAKIDGDIYCGSGAIPSSYGGSWAVYATATISKGKMIIACDNAEKAQIRIEGTANTNILIEWIALYEGEYTADNLPPYVYKGYVAEWAECRRYYKRIGGKSTTFVGFGGIYSSANKQLIMYIPTSGEMRINPTLIASGTIRCFSDVGTAYKTTGITIVQQMSEGIMVLVTMEATLDGGKLYFMRLDGAASIELSADL